MISPLLMIWNPLFCAGHIIRCLWGWVRHLPVSSIGNENQGLGNENLGVPVKYEFQTNNSF